MFCIINLRHNSTYVAPPAAGEPPFFSTHASPALQGKRYLCIHGWGAPPAHVVPGITRHRSFKHY